jgi:hypothetical protein
VDITLSEVVRQLNFYGIDYANKPLCPAPERTTRQTYTTAWPVYIRRQGNWVVTTGNYIPAKANNADREYFIWHQQHTEQGIHIGHVIRIVPLAIW